MSIVDAFYDDQTAHDDKTYFEKKMKYDPSKNTLTKRVNELKIRPGQSKLGVIKLAPTLGTCDKVSDQRFAEILSKSATGVAKWDRVPTIADYEDLEDWHDLEQTENAAYEASKKFIW